MLTRRTLLKGGGCALVAMGSAPRFLLRAAHAAAGGRGRAQHGGPSRRPGLRRGTPEHRAPAATPRRQRAGLGPRRVLRPPPGARPAHAPVGGGGAGRGPCLRVPPPHPPPPPHP